MSETGNNAREKKPRLSRLAIASPICALVGLLFLVFSSASGMTVLFCTVAFLIGLTAFTIIVQSNGSLAGFRYAGTRNGT